MTKQTFVYIVHARRRGSDQTHNYIVGVYSNAKAAINAAEREEEQRGGKYACDVMEWEVAWTYQGGEVRRPESSP